MSATPAIETAGLVKSYGDHAVLRGVDLSVPSGTVVALLGSNGAGKTTAVQVGAPIRGERLNASRFGVVGSEGHTDLAPWQPCVVTHDGRDLDSGVLHESGQLRDLCCRRSRRDLVGSYEKRVVGQLVERAFESL